jgi:hypothetical protein
MLSTRKSITLTGTSSITTDESTMTAVQMTANVSEQNTSSVNVVIVNQQLYDTNKNECRNDIDEFNLLVREIEDAETVE